MQSQAELKRLILKLDRKLKEASEQITAAFRESSLDITHTILAPLSALDLRNGNIKSTTANLKKIKSTQTLAATTIGSAFQIALAEAAELLRGVKAETLAFYSAEAVNALTLAQDAALTDAIDVMLLSLSQYRDSLTTSVVLSLAEAIATTPNLDMVEKRLLGIFFPSSEVGGKSFMTSIELASSEATQMLSAQVHKLIAEANSVSKYLYEGPSDSDNRPFCAERVGKIFSTEEVESWNSLNWAGKKPGNVWLNRGGYNCRHHLIAMIEN